ncbi:MAG: zinc ABC transporter substrate-binding protein, partial [Gammaproteobacteria bacterium]
VMTGEPVWASLVKEIGGDKVDVTSATSPFQDVHYIQARPSLIARMRRADLLVVSGADLEIGWLPVLMRQASNSKIQIGQPGYLEVAKHVPMLDVPSTVDRSQGDIHPYGNPHVQTSPHNIARAADLVAQRLEAIDPGNADYYKQRYAAFDKRWTAAMARWEKEAAPLKGMEVVTHHKSWVYMNHWLGLKEVGNLEPRPGVPPTAAHLSELLGVFKQHHVEAIIRAAYQDSRPSEWLSSRTGVPAIVIPHSPHAADGADDLFGMFDVMIQRLLKAHQQAGGAAQ